MSRPLLEVIKPGMYTTVQDLGRTGYQQYGMVVSGAMDSFALQAANLLVGNRRGEAALEMTVTGAHLRFLRRTVIALSGADMFPTLDGKALRTWSSIRVEEGQTLRMGGVKSGARAYLAVAGGIDVPAVMGSKSTYAKAGLGGYRARPLQKGDRLHAPSVSEDVWRKPMRRFAPRDIPVYRDHVNARVILGPDTDAFAKESVERFLKEPYVVTPHADRMGYRLKGPVIHPIAGSDILSDAVAPGTIQIPANGQPIVMLAERQTTGGYARIGTVISSDLPCIAQLMPGGRLSFQRVSLEEAHRVYREREALLRGWDAARRLFSVNP